MPQGKISYEEALKNADSKNNLALKIKLSGKSRIQQPVQSKAQNANNSATVKSSNATPSGSEKISNSK